MESIVKNINFKYFKSNYLFLMRKKSTYSGYIF